MLQSFMNPLSSEPAHLLLLLVSFMEEKTLTLKNGQKLLYASEESNSQNLKANNLDHASRGVSGHSDLEAGIYEGGLKIWECAVDLCNFLAESNASFHAMDVIELGCGAGLPSILALNAGATSVTLQDFNDFVLEAFTKKNFEINGADLSKCTFVAGSWDQQLLKEIGHKKFGLILTSETIYNEANYKALVDVMDALLAPNGRILLAAKNYYFGVGGSVASFEEFLSTHGIFHAQEVWSTKKSSVPRKILELKRRI